jgi:muramoyltetrapeptide carboxypeptidase LdcA involved in peptidoglycan recycling
MASIYPKALKAGDEVRVIAPASSLPCLSKECIAVATDRLENELGLKVTFGRHANESDMYGSSSAANRVEDLHEAFADKNVKAILSVVGGDNSGEMLPLIDWSLIKRNPKIFCGYSDITTLEDAIFAKTGLITFSGPHYSSFGMKKSAEYILETFKKAVMGVHKWTVLPSANWSSDAWYLDQEKREFIANRGVKVLRPGSAKGTIVGGNMSSIALLQGTEYMPKLEGSILFVEECDDNGAVTWTTFIRQLNALSLCRGFNKIKGLVIGRFQKSVNIPSKGFLGLAERLPVLSQMNIPIVYDADFGHTTPIFTFGIGGEAELTADKNHAELTFGPFVK